MRILSIIQPWASFIVHGLKTVETRSRPTTYRGAVAIHASKKQTSAIAALCDSADFAPLLSQIDHSFTALPRGQIIGIVDLIGCFTVDELATKVTASQLPLEKTLGDYRPGRWGWHLYNPLRFLEGVEHAGRLGLTTLKPDLLGKLWEAILDAGTNNQAWVAAALDNIKPAQTSMESTQP